MRAALLLALLLLAVPVALAAPAQAHYVDCPNGPPQVRAACILLCQVQHAVTSPPHGCS